MSRPTRTALGLIAVVLLAVGAWAMLSWPEERAGGMVLRAGLMAGAGWVVAPAVRRPRLASLAWLVALAVAVARPRFAVAVLVGALIWRLSARRAIDRSRRP